MKNCPDISNLVTFKKIFAKEIENNCEEDKVSSGLAVFVAAINQKEFKSQQKLSEFLGCNKAHTSRTLAKLQAKGLIEPLTARNTPIKLTEKGKTFATNSINKKEKLAKELVSGIPEEELVVFENVLNKIVENAKALNKKGV